MKLKSLLLLILLIIFASCQSKNSREETPVTEEEPAKLTTEQRLENIKSELKLVKAELTKEGSYDCCVQPGCHWCVLHEGECECHDNVKTGKEVCPGCGLGWHNGKGVVQGVKASQVKWNITHENGEAAEHGEGEDGGEDHKEGGHKH